MGETKLNLEPRILDVLGTIQHPYQNDFYQTIFSSDKLAYQTILSDKFVLGHNTKKSSDRNFGRSGQRPDCYRGSKLITNAVANYYRRSDLQSVVFLVWRGPLGQFRRDTDGRVLIRQQSL